MREFRNKPRWRPYQADYVWVDTCCIDKRSSAELSEAINSMYKWYQNSQCCVVFLSDVDSEQDITSSVWFKRSWTLQELIAPANVFFYSGNWKFLGSRTDLSHHIVYAFGIHQDVFDGAPIEKYSVAQRLSWAAEREADRVEDQAYSLMGLFDVNMPMLYGEGEKAFLRLQEEIIRRSDDHTIFAWRFTDEQKKTAMVGAYSVTEAEGYSVTNVGLSITLPLTPWHHDVYCALLNCTDSIEHDGLHHRMGIHMRLLPQRGQYARICLASMDWTLAPTFPNEFDRAMPHNRYSDHRVLVRQVVRELSPLDIYGFWIHGASPHTTEMDSEIPIYSLSNLYNNSTEFSKQPQVLTRSSQWSPHDAIAHMPIGCQGTVCLIKFDVLFDPVVSLVKLGFDGNFNPVIMLVRDANNGTDTIDPSPLHHFGNQWIEQVVDYNKWKAESDEARENTLNSVVFRVPKGGPLPGIINIWNLYTILRKTEIVKDGVWRKVWVVDLKKKQPLDD